MASVLSNTTSPLAALFLAIALVAGTLESASAASSPAIAWQHEIGMIGGFGLGAGIAIGSKGEVYAVDHGEFPAKLLCLNQDGTLRWSASLEPTLTATLYLDDQSNAYVADVHFSSLEIFDHTGRRLNFSNPTTSTAGALPFTIAKFENRLAGIGGLNIEDWSWGGVVLIPLMGRPETVFEYQCTNTGAGAGAIVGVTLENTIVVHACGQILYGLASNGHLSWKIPGVVEALALDVDEGVYAIKDGKFCLFQRGEEKWGFSMPALEGALTVVSGNAVWLYSSDGIVRCITKEGIRVWETRVPGFRKWTQGEMVLNQNLDVVIGGSNHVTCISVEGKVLWAKQFGHVEQHMALSKTGNLIISADGKLMSLATGIPTATGPWVARAADNRNSRNVGAAVRAPTLGSLAGKTLAAGGFLSNVQISIEHSSLQTFSLADGLFALSDVPQGSGYTLLFSKPGHQTKRLTGISVQPGINSLGEIELVPLTDALRLVPLVPNVNPPISVVAEGGVAYRYYRVLSGDLPAGGVTVTVRARPRGSIGELDAAEGDLTAMAELGNDVTDLWPGRVAGVSDPDGIVRVRLPSSLITVGQQNRFQTLLEGRVADEFTFRTIPASSTQLWFARAGIEAGLRKRKGVEAEVEVTRNGSIERIARKNKLTLSANETLGEGKVKFLGRGNAGAEASAFVSGHLGYAYGFGAFDPDPVINASKIFHVTADLMMMSPAGELLSHALAGFDDLGLSLLEELSGGASFGGWFDGELGFSLDAKPTTLRLKGELGLGAEGTGEVAYIMDSAQTLLRGSVELTGEAKLGLETRLPIASRQWLAGSADVGGVLGVEAEIALGSSLKPEGFKLTQSRTGEWGGGD